MEKNKLASDAISHCPEGIGKHRVKIHVDLEDLSRKAVMYGPLRVIGETVLNLCLMMNDQFRGHLNGSNMAGKFHMGQNEDLRSRSGPKKDRARSGR